MTERSGGGDFRIDAFLDWVEIRLTLAEPTQSRYLRAALPRAWAGGGKAPYVRSESGQSNNTDTVFTIRIQDPVSAFTVRMDLERLASGFRFAAPPQITAVEVGVDAHPLTDTVDLVALAERLYRGAAQPASNNRRIPGVKGTKGGVTSALESRPQNRLALQRGRPLFIGNEHDPVAQRIYVKDGNRARFEVTFKFGSVPFRTLEQWSEFRFTDLSNHFRWRRQSAAVSDFHQLLQDTRVVLAEAEPAGAKQRHRRLHRQGTEADHQLRELAYQALRRLTSAQRKAPRRWTASNAELGSVGGKTDAENKASS